MTYLEETWMIIGSIATGLAMLIGLYKNLHEIKRKLNEPEKKQTERIQALEEKTDTLAIAICALLRVEINTIFIKVNKEGEINPTDLELVTKLYESYKSLGGNGIIAKEMAVIDTLHVVSQ